MFSLTAVEPAAVEPAAVEPAGLQKKDTFDTCSSSSMLPNARKPTVNFRVNCRLPSSNAHSSCFLKVNN